MLTTIAVIAVIIGLIGILMAWVAGRKNQDMARRIDRVHERISALEREIESEHLQTEKAKRALEAEIVKLGGDPNGSAPPPTSDAPPEINEITPETLKARLDDGDEVVVVDMRQLFEYKSGHIPGAINIFVNDIPTRMGELPKDKDIVLQCWSGITSLQASAFLIDNSWSPQRVSSLIGGIGGWTQTYGIEGLEQVVD